MKTIEVVAEEALIREIREELSVIISVDLFVTTVDYDYPNFYIKFKKIRVGIY